MTVCMNAYRVDRFGARGIIMGLEPFQKAEPDWWTPNSECMVSAACCNKGRLGNGRLQKRSSLSLILSCYGTVIGDGVMIVFAGQANQVITNGIQLLVGHCQLPRLGTVGSTVVTEKFSWFDCCFYRCKAEFWLLCGLLTSLFCRPSQHGVYCVLHCTWE